ncbi:hypothetical protein EXIGLDRAFT_778048 [Exidia glandulosa HHB12029]|uniref:Uncharacterized protein n=1 Tax=Exidia glandulosa HHB12029 TaxID=1314781 RepID=A0A165CR86_EXIGL|nr:hypothetical protein EXIGLDRAFT_778048 [Exidia glandulosa HHB12029]
MPTRDFSDFDFLNERYARRWGSQFIIYGRPCSSLSYEACKDHATRLHRSVDQARSRHISISGWTARTEFKELITLKLIAAQLDEALLHWSDIIDEKKNRASAVPHCSIDILDVQICDALDSLFMLEQTAEAMHIPHYECLFIDQFRDDGSECICVYPAPTRFVNCGAMLDSDMQNLDRKDLHYSTAYFQSSRDWQPHCDVYYEGCRQN